MEENQMIMYLTVLVDILIILLLLVGDVVGIIAFLKKIKVVKEKKVIAEGTLK